MACYAGGEIKKGAEWRVGLDDLPAKTLHQINSFVPRKALQLARKHERQSRETHWVLRLRNGLGAMRPYIYDAKVPRSQEIGRIPLAAVALDA